jgi:hypothetical protein
VADSSLEAPLDPSPGSDSPSLSTDSEAERFLPHGAVALQQELAARPFTDPADADRFRAFSRLVGALIHYRFHEREQSVVSAWQSIGDDPDTADQAAVGRPATTPAANSASSTASDTSTDNDNAGRVVSAELRALLEHANYADVTMEDVEQALQEESLIPLRLSVDLDDYEELVIRRRGGHEEEVELKSFFGLRTKRKTITVDDRTVIFTRIKPAAWFAQRGIDPAGRNLVPGAASLKMFQNVPRADVEMLLPSTEVKFRTIDTLTMAVPAVASGIAVVATKLLPTIGLIALAAGFALGLRDERPALDQSTLLVLMGGMMTLGGFLFKQYSTLKNRRVNYLKTLSENLYFRSMGDGAGVLHTLLATAEQQEVAEVLLAYRFLLDEPDGLTADKLDRRIEDWYAQSAVTIDFDVPDAVAKLHELNLVEQGDDTTLRARPLTDSLAVLDGIWDDLFNYAEARTQSSGRAPAETSPAAGSGTGLGRWLRRVTARFNNESAAA